MEREPVEISRIARLYGLNEKTLHRQYKTHLSGFKEAEMPEDLLYRFNLGKRLSIDDTGLIGKDGNTVIGNKDTGQIVALVQGTKAAKVVELVSQIPFRERLKVEEISLDFCGSYDWATRTLFPSAIKTIDRFHVQQLVNDAMQSVRTRHRWAALKAAAEAKDSGQRQHRQANGETSTELLARGRYLLFTPRDRWTASQRERAAVLFESYPEIAEAYKISQALRTIYEGRHSVSEAKALLDDWYRQTRGSRIDEFVTCVKTIRSHEGRVLNYFINRDTNAFAESMNAKLKQFKRMCRGIRDPKFFLFRVGLYFA